MTALIVRMPLSGINPLKPFVKIWKMLTACSTWRLEPALREHSLEAVCSDVEDRDCGHRSDATLRNQSFEAIRVNNEPAHGLHHLEPAPRERSLEAVSVDPELHDCAHRSDATFWNCSFETIGVN
eukprot:6458173-Amphidinium_carterae.1